MQSRVRIGIPSKGRLKSSVENFFRTKSLDLIKNGLEREYVLNFENRTDIQPVLISDEIIYSISISIVFFLSLIAFCFIFLVIS